MISLRQESAGEKSKIKQVLQFGIVKIISISCMEEATINGIITPITGAEIQRLKRRNSDNPPTWTQPFRPLVRKKFAD